MKPAFSILKANHYSSEFTSSDYVSAEDLHKELGYDLTTLLKENPGYANTCATRVSLALLKSNIPFAGRLKVKDGRYKGMMLEPGAKLLADALTSKNAFGKPVLITDAVKASATVGTSSGVIFFWQVTGYDGGHIDLIESINSAQLCHCHCYFNCKEVWFRELP
jgi:hypothetical protein